ncbi:MAG TPA: hypothetical protein VLH08_14560, partial [Acidobacteriota bacterium]|nr:hypothetical protein [Acidobacteriota bacterium]
VNDPNACLLCDDFNDGFLSPDWTYVKQTWAETGGALVGTPANKKAEVIATPIFSAGCSTCSIEVVIQNSGGDRSRQNILGWYVDKHTLVELMIREDKDAVVLKQRINKTVVAKGKGNTTINPGVNYKVRISFNGTTFEVFVDDVSLFTMPAVGTPSGTFGFRVKNSTGLFDNLVIN